MDLSRLTDPFHANEVEWRIGRAGKNAKGIWATAFAYITNRAIQQRLDEVCGPGNWCNEFSAPPNAAPGSAALCTIKIKIGDEWVGKSDGAENTDMEATKGGLSDSMKRAAVQWGIGRYLYDLEEMWVETSDDRKKDWRYQQANEKKGIPAFYWQNPTLPTWALPKQTPEVKATVQKLAAEVGAITADKLDDSEFYQKAIAGIPKLAKLDSVIQSADKLKARKIAHAVSTDHYHELDGKLAARAIDVCKTPEDFAKCETFLRGLHGELRINETAYMELAMELMAAKDSKLGVAA